MSATLPLWLNVETCECGDMFAILETQVYDEGPQDIAFGLLVSLS